MKPTPPTVKDIQWRLRCYCDERNHKWVTPNAVLFNWESDLVSVTKNGLVHEFEINRSRADLLRDLDKPKHKERSLLTGKRPMRTHEFAGRSFTIPESELYRPNYFWFVVPEELMELAKSERMPRYAGVLVIGVDPLSARACTLEVLREPERLHTATITDALLLQLAEKMHYRFWGLMRAEQNKKVAKRVHKMFPEK